MTTATGITPASLAGRTALVTGASSGIGRAIAERLGGAGAHVWLAGRSAEPMNASADAIRAAGGKAEVRSVDLRDLDAVRALVDEAHRATGRFDLMVNNAGLSHPAPILAGDAEQWREMFEVNVLALLVGSQAAVHAMRAAGNGGHVVNISSIAAHRRDSGVYGATKHAVNALCATLRVELEDDPIRVVNIMPGAIATNFARNFDPAFLEGFAKMAGLDTAVKQGEKLPDEAVEQLQAKMGQVLGHPDDVARAVIFAVSQPHDVNIEEVVVRPQKALQF
ncbi:MAG TPA: SDR family oxidoreductase [Pseudomonadales bacterium]|nr:SDR family oxidoreductase [Pseudomonadales bacterium]